MATFLTHSRHSLTQLTLPGGSLAWDNCATPVRDAFWRRRLLNLPLGRSRPRLYVGFGLHRHTSFSLHFLGLCRVVEITRGALVALPSRWFWSSSGHVVKFVRLSRLVEITSGAHLALPSPWFWSSSGHLLVPLVVNSGAGLDLRRDLHRRTSSIRTAGDRRSAAGDPQRPLRGSA